MARFMRIGCDSKNRRLGNDICGSSFACASAVRTPSARRYWLIIEHAHTKPGGRDKPTQTQEVRNESF